MNKPVAWMRESDKDCVSDKAKNELLEEEGKDWNYVIPLYTHQYERPHNAVLVPCDKLAEMQAELALLKAHPVKEQKCIVKDCENHKHEGRFVGDLCKPCHQFITTGEGVYSQAYRNTHPVKELTCNSTEIANEKEFWESYEKVSSESYPVKELTDEEINDIYDEWQALSGDPVKLYKLFKLKAQEK